MEFPKMLYRAEQPFEDQEALKAALQTGVVKTFIVESAEEQKAAVKKGWTEDLGSLVKSDAKPESEAK